MEKSLQPTSVACDTPPSGPNAGAVPRSCSLQLVSSPTRTIGGVARARCIPLPASRPSCRQMRDLRSQLPIGFGRRRMRSRSSTLEQPRRSSALGSKQVVMNSCANSPRILDPTGRRVARNARRLERLFHCALSSEVTILKGGAQIARNHE